MDQPLLFTVAVGIGALPHLGSHDLSARERFSIGRGDLHVLLVCPRPVTRRARFRCACRAPSSTPR